MLVTARTERVFRPGYGAGVPEFLFGMVNEATLELKAGEIREYLQARLTTGNIVSVTMTSEDERDGTVLLRVLFQLTPNGEVFDVFQTFTGLVTEESFR
jgi:phage baseplate assembly protein W